MLEERSRSQKVCLCVTHCGARAAGLWAGPTEDASSGSHLGSGGIALARCVSFSRLRAFCLPRNRTVPPSPIFILFFFVFLFFLSHRLPPPISLASFLLSHANSLICKREKTSERGREREKWRAEPPAEEGAPLHTHTTSAPHPILSLSSPAHLNKLTPLDVSCARARTLMQKKNVQARTHSSKHSQTHTRL